MAKTYGYPVRYDKAEFDLINALRKSTKPRMSYSDIQRRAVRFAVPKMLTGELPISETVQLRVKSTKKTKKSAVPA